MIWQAILAFSVMLVLDFVYALYTLYLTDKKIVPAASCAVGIIVCSSATTLLVVSDPWLILPTAGGAFLGTVLGIHVKSLLGRD